jgi:hypothetical protein
MLSMITYPNNLLLQSEISILKQGFASANEFTYYYFFVKNRHF